jgi:lipopolysaccharide transport system ATP-binding protein
MIRLDGVCKQYRRSAAASAGLKSLLLKMPSTFRHHRSRPPIQVLTDLTFDVRRGDCLGLIGRNGAGKSTTLGLIAGVLHPTSGTIETKGRISPLLQIGAGFHAELNGRENIFLNAILLGQTRRQVRDRFDEIVAFSELEDYIDEPLRTYSSGMRARLGFATAIHIDPDILLLDEILAVGDLAFQKKCRDRIHQLRENQGVTTVFVTHSTTSMVELCNRAVLLEKGRVVADGVPEEVAHQYEAMLKSSPSLSAASRGPRPGRQ